MAFVAKPAISVLTVNAPILNTNNLFLPNVSAIFAKKRRNAPELNLVFFSISHDSSTLPLFQPFQAFQTKIEGKEKKEGIQTKKKH